MKTEYCLLLGSGYQAEKPLSHNPLGQKLSRLKELSKMYALFAPIQAMYMESQSLKGFAKMKYDKEQDSLSKYPE